MIDLDNISNNNVVYYLDSIMGSGKTTSIYAYMNSKSDEKWLYVNPLLSEVEGKIIGSEGCAEIGMIALNTDEYRTKREDLLNKLREGKNISITQKMYCELTKEHLYYISKNKYNIVVDEEVSFVENLEGYSFGDIKFLFEQGCLVVDHEDMGRVKFKENIEIDNDAFYSKLRNLCDIGCVYSCKSQQELFVTQLPLGLIQAAKSVLVITYMYVGSLMYTFLEMKGIEHRKFEGISIKYTNKEIKDSKRNYIEFIETPLTKKVQKYPLTYSWYENTSREATQNKKEVFKAIRSIKMKTKCDALDLLYTMPKKISENKNIGVKEISHNLSYLAPKIRGTNDYRDRTVLVHCLDIHPNVNIVKYITSYGYKIDRDRYALDALIQWVWRSSIRNNNPEPIKLCILSPRMLHLFKQWLAEES